MNRNIGGLIGGLGRVKCECHDCTQARWKMSGMAQQESMLEAKGAAVAQLQQAMQQIRQPDDHKMNVREQFTQIG